MITDFEVYLITGAGYWYVGSTTVGAERRFAQHKAGLGNAKQLLSKMRELGPDSFHQTVIERHHGDPIEAEQRWYDFYISIFGGHTSLNHRRPGGWPDNTGYIHTPDSRAKMSAKKRGRSRSPETIEKIRATMQGRPIAVNSMRVACECGMTSVPGPMGQHFIRTGHQRKTQ